MPDLQKFLKEAAPEIVALGKKHGYTLTEAEIEKLADTTGELSDEQLQGVAGGWGGGLGSGV